MMNDRLDRNQQERIENWYREHPLFCACQHAFLTYQVRMRHLMFSPTEVFVEAIEVIDSLFDESTDINEYIRNLWNHLTIRYKLWQTGAPDDDEYLAAVSAVFYTTAVVLSTHTDPYYKESVKEMLLGEIDSHTTVVKQEEDKVLICLSQYASEIKQWLEKYVNNDNYLSDEINEVAQGRNPGTTLSVTHKRKTVKTKKSFDPDTFRETFVYAPDGMSRRERDIRLKMAFNKAKGILIVSDTHYDTFEALLSGKPLDVKVYWIGTNAQLRYLFNLLVTKSHLVTKPTGGLNQILAARFKHENGTPFTPEEIRNAGDDGDMSAVNKIVEILTPSPMEVEDLEQQLSRLLTEEQENTELGRKKAPKQEGMSYSNRPNQHTRATRRKK